MATLAFIAGVASLIKCISFALYSQLYIPIIWLLIAVIIIISGSQVFYLIMLLMSCSIVTLDNFGYRSLGLFILMLFVLSKNTKQILIALALIFTSFITVLSIQHRSIIEIMNIIIQIAFATFCYYGFIYTSSRAFGPKSKLVYTEKEYKVLYALATQDKTQKEIAYDLGLSSADMGRTLASVKKKNNYETSEALVRQFAIELYATQKGDNNET